MATGLTCSPAAPTTVRRRSSTGCSSRRRSAGSVTTFALSDLSSNDATPATDDTTTVETVCYARGTLILTVRGEIAVEDLAIGDVVLTATGARRPISWLGHRSLDCRGHARPELVHPIRIAQHAIGENKPAQDLYVSPAHAICIDVLGEVLIPACALANGSTITQVDVDQITYWHIELDSHDILIANGLPAESYIDTGNRCFFVESDIVDFEMSPDADLTDPARRTHADFCRPFVMDGPILDAVRLQLRRRARTLGWTLDTSQPWADLHLVGRQSPDRSGRARPHCAIYSAGRRWRWLARFHQHAAVRCHRRRRRTSPGVCLAGLTIDEGFGERSVVALDDPLLGEGLYQIEDSRRRWTAGRALLPAALWDRCREEFFLLVDIACPALSRWTKPLEQTAPAGGQMSAKLATSA